MKNVLAVLGFITTVFIVVKGAWLIWMCRKIGTFDTEKADILQRRNYLVDQIITTPEEIIRRMPAEVGGQIIQGEWALYSCSMLSAALVNIAKLYPETKSEALKHIDDIIKIVLSPELRRYDTFMWCEDPLTGLDGDNDHMSYISHLAWIICGYKVLGGNGKYDQLLHSLCEAMHRNMLQSDDLNLLTYPGNPVYFPDMLVAIVALTRYSELYDGKYRPTVDAWVESSKTKWTNKQTGLLVAQLDNELSVCGSYAALNCYYLTFVDKQYAAEQWEKFKEIFGVRFPVCGVREYHDKRCVFGMDIDAGPIIFGLSPSGTAFSVGCATYFNERQLRNGLLRTAELAGSSVVRDDKRHYLLANIALVGEAIMLAMRTHCE